MEDSELRQQFQSIDRQFESIDRQFQAINQQFQSMTTLIVNVKESLEREIGGVRADVGSLGERIDRMDVRLGKIAAGSGYVTRLVEWSEKQDRFQLDILERVQKLETRLDKIQKNGQ
jgi:uncharacterized protein Yka (UPF0111/DUF47 family)